MNIPEIKLIEQQMGLVKKAENAIDGVYQKINFHLPKGFINFLVQIWPYLAIIGAVLWGLGALFSLFGIFSFSIGALFSLFELAVSIIVIYLLASAYTPLLAKQKRGWDKIFALALIAPIYSLISSIGSYFTALAVAQKFKNTGVNQFAESLGLGSITYTPSLAPYIIGFIIFLVLWVTIGMYILFEMRSSYSEAGVPQPNNQPQPAEQQTTQPQSDDQVI